MKRHTYKIAETDYNRMHAAELRGSVVELRDNALEIGAAEWAVLLSHVVAFMAVAIEEMYGDPPPAEGPKGDCCCTPPCPNCGGG